MNTLVQISTTDITPYIDWKSYKMAKEPAYESWLDGNFVEHRVVVRERIKGSFRVWLCGMDDMDTDAFMSLVNGATTNHVTALTVFDGVANTTVQINAFLKITPGDHKEMMNGDYYDTFTVEVIEK